MSIQRDSQTGFVTGSSLGTTQDTYTYDSFGDLQTYQVGSLYSLSLARDAIRRIASKTETIGSSTKTYSYSYDASGRLTAVSVNSAPYSSYTYDSNSNRIAATVNNQSVTGTYDAQDKIITYGSNSYTFDANGELATKTTSGGTTSYAYWHDGRPNLVTFPDGSQITNLFDAHDRVVGTFNGENLTGGLVRDLGTGAILATLDGNGNLIARFAYGTKLNVPDIMILGGVWYRIVSDYLGSVRFVVNTSNGQVAQEIDYDEFGNVLQDTNPGFQPFGFAGGEYNAQMGTVVFGTRAYDPLIGRWSMHDPILFAGGDTNLYGYVLNDPINYVDPTGLYPDDPAFIPGQNENGNPLYDRAVLQGAAAGAVLDALGFVAAPLASIQFQGPGGGGRIFGSTMEQGGMRNPFFRLDNSPIDWTGEPTLHYHTPWNPSVHNPIDPFVIPAPSKGQSCQRQ